MTLFGGLRRLVRAPVTVLDEWDSLQSARAREDKDDARCESANDNTACAMLRADVQLMVRIEQDFAKREGPVTAMTG